VTCTLFFTRRSPRLGSHQSSTLMGALRWRDGEAGALCSAPSYPFDGADPMRSPLLAAIAAFALLPAAAACAQPASSAEVLATLRWEADSAGRDRGKVQLELDYRTAHSRSTYSRTMDLPDLRGLTADALQGRGGPVAFRLARDSGSLDCRGSAAGGRGSGECRFLPSATFAAELARRGFGTPSASQLFQLAMTDAGVDLIDELARQNYPRPTLDALVDAGNHGATLAYLREMAASAIPASPRERSSDCATMESPRPSSARRTAPDPVLAPTR
jgi:hypothetical protein